jgi:pyruvate/2-oxoglutarate dehydrogenase complex dihydrolipoamide dehydrogenase (E3) component
VTDAVKKRLAQEGIRLVEGCSIKRVAKPPGDKNDGVSIDLEFADGKAETLAASHLLIAAGRAPNIATLGLDAAGIDHGKPGITVDARLRTSNRKVFAIGDIAAIGGKPGLQFTHAAGYHAGIVIRNILFKLPAKVDTSAFPWVTYTDPEIAHVGKTEAQVKDDLGRNIRILRFPFCENDRAQAERDTDGLIKVVADKKGRIYGCSIAGPHAGELILPWALAISQKLKIGAMAGVVAPYPTLSEVSKRAAGSFYTPSLFSERMKKIVRFLLKLPF